ncbi:MAG: LamG-like jellyroll fold domain-containing protein [Chitinophagales bacterium]
MKTITQHQRIRLWHLIGLVLLALNFAPKGLSAQCDVSNGLLGQWKFDNNYTNSVTGSTLSVSTSGNGSFGTDRFGTTSFAAGTSDYYFRLILSSAVSGDLSFCGWVKRTAALGGPWAAVGAGSQGTAMIVTNGTNYGLSNGSGTNTFGTAACDANVWHFIAYTRSGSTASLYYDGAFVNQVTLTTVHNLSMLSGNSVSPNNPNTIPGLYDDFRVYSRTLSAAEVLAIYNATNSSASSVMPPQVTTEPTGANFCPNAGVSKTFSPVFFGSNLSYRWQKNGADIPSATASTYTINNMSGADAGTYRVIATNACGSDTSVGAVLTALSTTSLPNPMIYIPVIPSIGNGYLNFSDFSGNNLNANFMSYLQTDADVNGTSDNAVVLNSTTQYGEIPHQNLMNVTNQITVSCWFKASNIASPQRLIDKYSASGSYLLDIYQSRVRFLVAGGSHSPALTLQSNTWYHVAATYDGVNVKVYINGTLYYTNPQSGNILNNINPIRLGIDQSGGNNLVGRLDEIRIYNSVLNDIQIQGLYDGPRLAGAPQSVDVCSGGTVSLAASASGSGTTYQWKLNGVDVSGATSPSYNDNNVLAADTGWYSLQLSRNCYQQTIPLAHINFPNGTDISNMANYWPFDSSLTTVVGSANLASTAYGFSADRFGLNGNALNLTSTFPQLIVSPNLPTGNQTFSFWFNSNGAVSPSRALLHSAPNNTSVLWVNAAGAVGIGYSATPFIIAHGQWYHIVLKFNAASGLGTLYINGSEIFTAQIPNGAIYLSHIGCNNSGSYANAKFDDFRVYNYLLNQHEIFTLANTSGFSSNIASVTACPGSPVTFTATTVGSVSYQWKKDGSAIIGANGATYTINSVALTHAGNYTCVITDLCTGVTTTSNTAVLTVPGNASITTQPAVSNATPTCGSSISFSITATNASAYQWRKDGNAIPGATNATYVIPAVGISTSGSYDCLVTGCNGSITSNAVVVTVGNASISKPLMHYWKFNNGLTDIVGNNNLTAVGANSFGADRFATASNAVSIAASASTLTLATPVVKDTITISVWYKHTVTTGIKTILGDTASRWGDMLTINGNTIVWSKPGTGWQSTGITLTAGNWYHIVITKQMQSMQFFLNGALAFTAPTASLVPYMMSGTGNWGTQLNRIGNTAPPYNSQPAQGAIDEIKIYNGILTATEIAALYSEAEIYNVSGFSGTCIGSTATATVSAGSLPTTVYQWKKNGVNVNGATSATLTLNNVQAGDAGTYTCAVSSSQGCLVSTSSSLILSPGAGNVSISSQPQSISKCVGQTATFSIATTGATVTYQWKKNGVAINGATGNAYTTAAVAATDSGAVFTCDVIGGSCGTISSGSAILQVNTPASIAISPATAVVCAGSAITLTASGASTYSWSNNGGSNAAAVYTPSGNTSYTVTATDANNCTASLTKTVTVNPLPTPAILPASPTVCLGGTSTLTASGGASYSWSNGGGSAAAASFTPSGTTTYTVTATLNNCTATASRQITVNNLPVASILPATAVNVCAGGTTNLTASGGTSYTWSNGAGSSATISVTPSNSTTYQVTVTDANNCSATASKLVNVWLLPTPTMSPASATICSGASQQFTAGGGVSYAWSNNGGANASATFAPTVNSNYTVTVTNANNCTATASASLNVNAATAINGQPQTQSTCTGASVSFSVNAVGTNLVYQWKKGASNINGATSSTYTIPSVVAGDAGSYSVVVSGSCGSVTSNAAVLSVTGSLQISTNPQAVNACAGSHAFLAVVANGANVVYNWKKNGNVIQNTNNDTLYFNGLTAADAGNYICEITSGCGNATSQPAAVSIKLPTTSVLNQSVCFGRTFNFNSQVLAQSGTFKDTLINASGCDSIITLNLTVLPQIVTQQLQVLCQGHSLVFNGQQITQAGIYRDTFSAVSGCDSIVVLQVQSAQPTIGSITQTACGQFVFNGQTLTTSGTYLDTIFNIAGCDSVITLQLTITQPSAATISDTICAGASYLFGTQQLTAPGAYQRTIGNAAGCDSVITLQLVVRPALSPTIQQAGYDLSTQNFAAYQWQFNGADLNGATGQGVAASASGWYSVRVTDDYGCSATSQPVEVNQVGIGTITKVQLQVYPNPATDILTISTNTTVPLQCRLFDANGKLIASESFKQTIALPMANRPSGIYQLDVMQDAGHVNHYQVVKP